MAKLKLILFGVLVSFSLFAAGERAGFAPVSETYPNQGGVLFPGIPSAAGVNAAALGRTAAGPMAQLAYTPALKKGESSGYSFGFAGTQKSFGLGLGARGTHQNGTGDDSVFGGIGTSMEMISLGVSVRAESLRNNPQAEVDFGLIIGEATGFTGGIVLYNLDESARTAVGFGYRGGEKYNLEATLLLPHFSDPTENYTITLSSSFHAKWLSLHFRTSYQTVVKAHRQTVAATVWVNPDYNLVFQFASPSRWTFALAVNF